jgi:Zn-dependent M16 (insulinase) family peptidase
MHVRRFLIAILLLLVVANAFAAPAKKAVATLDFAQLSEGQAVHGFKVTTLYLNDADKPMGARFIHRKSGFTLDLLRMESVPQGHTWVNSFPVSDQGEPHTQEHLLVGKGRKGRAFAGLDTMWLSTSNAYTEQWRTSYTFYTSAGAEVFFKLLDAELDALLNPDYTDEEIRREVRNFGVTENPDKSLRLEEKGSVYNEMTSSSGNSYDRLFRLGGQLVYGEKHPFSYNSGGEPSGIRTMQPSDIRSFHDQNYYLGNMGSIISVPPSMPLGDTLTRIDAILSKLQGSSPTRPAMRLDAQPKPTRAAAGTVAFAEYPNKNAQQPSPVMVVWPALGELDANDSLLADLFFSNVAGDATTNLYKGFIDSKTRTLDVGAKSIGSGIAIEPGRSSYILLNDVDAANLTKEKLEEIRKAVTGELARIAAFEDGSPELAEFNNRIAGRVVETRRALSKFVNSPPRFGFRNTFSEWMNQLLALEQTPGFRKSLTMKPELAAVNALLASKKNFWRDSLKKWGLVGGAEPYVVAAKANPEILTREETERLARSNAEAARLAAQYNVTDAHEAIKRYGTESDAASAKIDADAKSVIAPRFVDNPPMTIDDQLQYKTSKLAHDVPVVASTFENMSSATTGMALRLDGLPPDDWRYVSLLPLLLTRVGVIENGQPVSFDLMTERLRKEILSLNASFSTSYRTGRTELMVRGAGNDPAEAQRAIGWMRLVLEHPDWRVENLPRIRDAVDQSLSSLRNTMQGSEESWVNNPPDAYRRQDRPLLLAATSFLTRTHNALRLRWMLKEAAPADREAISSYLTSLAGAAKSASRADLKALAAGKNVPASLQPFADSLAQLPAGAKTLATDALHDLDLTLVEIPDSSLAAAAARGECAALRGRLERDAEDARGADRGDGRRAGCRAGRAADGEGRAAGGGPAAAARRHRRHAGVRRPDRAEHERRRGPHVGARRDLCRFRQPGEAARLSRYPALRRLRLARHLPQDYRRRAGVQQRHPRRHLRRPPRLLRGAHPRAAADRSLRRRRGEGQPARRQPRRLHRGPGIQRAARRAAVRVARGGDGQRSRRRPDAGERPQVPSVDPRAPQGSEPRQPAVRPQRLGVRAHLPRLHAGLEAGRRFRLLRHRPRQTARRLGEVPADDQRGGRETGAGVPAGLLDVRAGRFSARRQPRLGVRQLAAALDCGGLPPLSKLSLEALSESGSKLPQSKAAASRRTPRRGCAALEGGATARARTLDHRPAPCR